MFRKKIPSIGKESILGRRSIIQLRDKLIDQFSLNLQVGDLILGRRKKNDLKVVSTKFKGSDSKSAIIYRVEFNDHSNFYFDSVIADCIDLTISHDVGGNLIDIETNQTSGDGVNGVPKKHIVEGQKYHYSPNVPNLKNFPVTFPWLFELDMGRLLPTMHLLWIHHSLFSIPKIYILKNTKGYIFNGADLMMGGVVFEASKDITSIKKDQIWTINCIGEQFPIAIGFSLVDWDEISDPSSRKGKIIKVVHYCSDALSTEGNMIFNTDADTPHKGLLVTEGSDVEAVSSVCEAVYSLKVEEVKQLNHEMTSVVNEARDIQIYEEEKTDHSGDTNSSCKTGKSDSENPQDGLSQDAYDYLIEGLFY